MRAAILLTAATFFWGLNFHFAGFMLTETTFIESATWRYTFGVALLVLINWKAFTNLGELRKNLKGVFLVGFVGLFGFNIFFFSGLQYTSAVNAALIIGLNPITTALLSSLILKTKIKPFHLVGVLLSFVGIIYLLTRGNTSALLKLTFNEGDILILVANFLFAMHHVWVKKYRDQLNNKSFTTLTNLMCLLPLVIIVPFSHGGNYLAHTVEFWLSTMGIGLFGTALAFLLWNEGVSAIGADRAGLFMNFVPLFTAATAVWFGELIETYHLLSGALIIGGLVFTQLYTVILNRRLSQSK